LWQIQQDELSRQIKMLLIDLSGVELPEQIGL